MLSSAICFDIETVTKTKLYTDLPPQEEKMWEERCDMIYSKYKSSYEDFYNECWSKWGAVSPEYSRMICFSFTVRHPTDNSLVAKSYYIEDIDSEEEELKLIDAIFNLFNYCYSELNLKYLCGHNIKAFDIPYICKKAISIGKPYSSFPVWLRVRDSKPWELNYIYDSKELYKFGSTYMVATLEETANALGIESPKEGEVKGSNLYDFFWNKNGNIEDIASYCERDTTCTYQVIEKLI